ncbi:MAG: ABC transporter ATP-binding protein [Lachnospirales bacterium]
MLKVKNLNITYDNKKIVEDINFNANKGELCVFLGFTGAGKTSIFNSIVNLVEYEGTITFNDEKIVNKDITISMSTQHYDLYNFKTVYQNIVLGLKLKKIEINKEQIFDLLKSFDLYEHRNKFPNQLSGGQKQKVSLLRSIVQEPELFLLDEPFSALDSFTREYMQQKLLKYLEEKKCVTLLITHSIEEALFLGDKIFILSEKPSKIVKIIENEKGKDKTSEDFLKKVIEIRKFFNL